MTQQGTAKLLEALKYVHANVKLTESEEKTIRAAIARGEESADTVEALIEVMKGIDHFKDALDFRDDPLSRALRQWIEAGSAILSKATASQP